MPQLNCIDCNKLYEEKDIEPYRCPSCLATHKAHALELDKKTRKRRPVISALQEYDNAPKVHGFMRVR
jgi:hypothetical protein